MSVVFAKGQSDDVRHQKSRYNLGTLNYNDILMTYVINGATTVMDLRNPEGILFLFLLAYSVRNVRTPPSGDPCTILYQVRFFPQQGPL